MPPRIAAGAHDLRAARHQHPGRHIVQSRPAHPTTVHESPLPYCGRGVLGFDIACQRREARMPAYFVVELDTKNMDAMAEYRAAVPGTLEQHGGRFLVRGGATELVDGQPEPNGIFSLEF